MNQLFFDAKAFQFILEYRVKSNLDKLISLAYITPRVETTLNAKGKLLEREMR